MKKDNLKNEKQCAIHDVSKSLPVESCCLLIERITYINRLTTDKEKAERLIELVKATGFELTYKGNVC